MAAITMPTASTTTNIWMPMSLRRFRISRYSRKLISGMVAVLAGREEGLIGLVLDGTLRSTLAYTRPAREERYIAQHSRFHTARARGTVHCAALSVPCRQSRSLYE